MAHYFEEQTDIKLIILFITENFKCPVTNQQIVEVALTKDILNYFDLKESLNELTDNALLEAYADSSHTYYRTTEKGAQTLEFFKDRIPYSVQEGLLLAIKEVRHREQTEKDITAEYEKVNDLNYTVKLSVSECGYPLFQLNLSVADEHLASRMCLAFRKAPQKYYQDIFQMFSEEE